MFRRGGQEAKYAMALAARLHRLYTPVLQRVIGRPGPVAIVAVVVFAATMLVVQRLGTEFIAELDEGSITIQAARDPSVWLTRRASAR